MVRKSSPKNSIIYILSMVMGSGESFFFILGMTH